MFVFFLKFSKNNSAKIGQDTFEKNPNEIRKSMKFEYMHNDFEKKTFHPIRDAIN